MARVNNLSNFLTDVADAIKTKKGSQTAIPAANFDTEILALPSQGVYEQKTVNVSANGSQTILPSSGYDAIDELTLTVAVPEKQLQTKEYSFTQNTSIELSPDTGYDGFDTVTVNINVPSQQINNQNKTITENGVYTADSGYTGLGTVTVNVSGGGSSDVKLFNTVQEMNADPNPEDGDLALVYGMSYQPSKENMMTQSIKLTNTIVLDEKCTSESSFGGNYIEESPEHYDSFYGSINNEHIEISGETENGSFNYQYTSSDGITYTCENITDPVELTFRNQLKLYGENIDIIQSLLPDFEGLYQNCRL